MSFTFSGRTWALLITMMILNVVVLAGIVTGIIPDVLRLVASVGAIISIGVDWRQSRQG
jgi:hypothetical protein